MDDAYLDAVLEVVAAIPPGHAMTYGGIADVVGAHLGQGGPRQVGQIMSHAGGGVPWWRVVSSAGSPPHRYLSEALRRLATEACPLTGDGSRVDLRRAAWDPPDDVLGGPEPGNG